MGPISAKDLVAPYSGSFTSKSQVAEANLRTPMRRLQETYSFTADIPFFNLLSPFDYLFLSSCPMHIDCFNNTSSYGLVLGGVIESITILKHVQLKQRSARMPSKQISRSRRENAVMLCAPAHSPRVGEKKHSGHSGLSVLPSSEHAMPFHLVRSPRVGGEPLSGASRLSVLPSSEPTMPCPPVLSPCAREETPLGYPRLSVLPLSEPLKQQPRAGSVHSLRRILLFGLFCKGSA